MGQTLSEPVKEKHSDRGSDKRIVYASSAMQGWRISMEDAHTAELTLKDKNGYSFFGVYDGHGGQNVAKYSGAHLHERIARDPQFSSNLEDAIKNGFLGTDEDLKNDPQYANDPSGCTAVTAVVTPDDWIFVGNAGDSRAVMSKDGDALPMSIDHKPLNKEESSRIQKAGGFVEFGRVNGNLALSRAIGDFEFKQNPNLSPEEQIVTAYPDVKKELIIREKTEFLVLACDGIWDCLSSQQVVNFIRRDIAQSKSLQTACENLMERCLAKDSELGGIGCDNMTVIIVGFLNGKNENDWYDWMASRYGNVGPVYDEEHDKQKGNDMSTDYNDDDADEGLEIPSEQADEYLPDDNDLENQNELTIDDIPHRRESTDSDISSRSNSTDSVSKIVVDNNKEKKNDNDAINSPISNTPQSQKSPNNNTDNNSSAESTTIHKSPTEEAVNSVSSDGKETGKNPYNSKTWPGSKK